MISAHTFLQQRGWVSGAGGSYYLPGGHPHIHIQVNTANIDVDNNSNNTRDGIIAAYRELWSNNRISLVALSRGSGNPGNRDITATVEQDGWEGVMRKLEAFETVCLTNANGDNERAQIADHIITMRNELELMNAAAT